MARSLPQLGGVLPAPQSFGITRRRDPWWITPTATFVGLGAFVVYSTWAVFAHHGAEFGNYVSPIHVPVLFGDTALAWFGPQPASWPALLPWAPGVFLFWAPAGLRLTCYYYRGSYYKAFWASPASCTVGKPWNTYRGENSFPLILQNVHRYFLYIAVVWIGLHCYYTWGATRFADAATGEVSFGIGVGTLVMALNTVLLAGYTFGCHSLRHLAGGFLNRLSGRPLRRCAYECTGWFNLRHMNFAWASLVWVMVTDLYVRLCASGVVTDIRIL